MSLLSQIIQLLSEPPGNIVYHLVTLFALQAVLGMALSRWRQDHADHVAWRTMVAAAAIFLARLVLLILSLIWQDNAVLSVTYLPPLSQAVHTITAVFFVWSLLPAFKNLPRLNLVLLTAALILIGVMTVSFLQQWQPLAGTGIEYNSTPQATIWGIVQLVIITAGLIFVLTRRRTRHSLRPLLLGLLLLAYLAHFYNYPEIIPTDTNIAYWLRLGYLVVLPLWAVFAYRHSLQQIIASAPANFPADPVWHLPATLPLADTIIQTLDTDQVVQNALGVTVQVTGVRFAGIALAIEDNPNQLRLITNLPQVGQDVPRSWLLQVDNWPAFRLAREQSEGVELRPDGLGARQLHLLYTELALSGLSNMIVHSLQVGEAWLGLLLLAQAGTETDWPKPVKTAVPHLADFIARALANSREHAAMLQQLANVPRFSPAETIDSGRIIAMEEERAQLQADLETAQDRARQAEARAAEARKQAYDLAATLEEMERVSRDERIAELEAEIASLQESLIDAEEAMAMAAAGESALSTDWLMHTITRYSGQVEAAQEKIKNLEEALRRRDVQQGSELLTGLAQELRTPMTSIAGYSDLLLSETIGILGAKQREFLQRIKANTERMGTLMDQILQVTVGTEEVETEEEPETNLVEALETAVHAVINQIREKHLRLDLNLEPNLPSLPVNRDTLHQVLVHLLNNACRASVKNEYITVTVQAKAVAAPSQNGHPDLVNFVHIMVQDSGSGISVEDQAHVFDPQYQAAHPLIPGLGDTGAGLAIARSLAVAHGGRMWVDGTTGSGTIFSLLFPLQLEKEKTKAELTALRGKAK